MRGERRAPRDGRRGRGDHSGVMIGQHRGAGYGSRLAEALLVSSLLTPLVSAALGGRAAADGAEGNGLVLRVSVNSRPGVGALSPGIRVGDPVLKTYRLVNRKGTDLYDVRVDDPSLPGVAIRCPDGDRVRMLRGLSSATCTAMTTARSGVWAAEALASGRIPYLHTEARARARSGYAGVGGTLALSESVRVTGQEATIRYVVTNTGNRPVHDVRVSDPLVAATVIDCAGGRPVVARLDPGRPALCRVVIRRGPGAYISQGVAEGSDRLTTLGRSGASVAPPKLIARAATRFVVPALPAPPQAPARRVVPRRTPPAAAPPTARSQRPVAPPAPGPPALPAAVVPPLPPPGIAAPGLAPGAPVAPAPAEPPAVAAVPGAAAGGAGLAAGAAVGGAGLLPGSSSGGTGQVPGATVGGTGQVPQARQPPVRSGSILSRFYRPGQGPTGLGALAALFLVLLPAAMAAAILGTRRG